MTMMNFTLNGTETQVDVSEGSSLLHLLRGPLGLSGPRFGCGAEQCGSCMVLVDDVPAYACTLGAEAVAGKRVMTSEGLGGFDQPHPLQAAMLVEQAGQCGWCLSGIMVSASALLAKNPDPDEATIRLALDPHLCRCGSHNRIIRAVQRAARELRA